MIWLQRKISFVSPERQRKCTADSPNSDRRSLGITPFRKENTSRVDEHEIRVLSTARKSICFGDSGGLAGMMRERRGAFLFIVYVKIAIRL